MPTLRRRAVAVSAAVLAVTAALPAAPVAAAVPTVIDSHDSSVPTRVFDLSSSAAPTATAGGTVFGTDIGGYGRNYLVMGELTTGSSFVDLGPANFARVRPAIRGNTVALPQQGAGEAVTQVKSCNLGTCPTLTTLNAPTGTQYVGHGQDRALFWQGGVSTSTLTAITWSPSSPTSTAYPLPINPAEPPVAEGDTAGIVVSGGGDLVYVNRSTSAVTLLNGYGNQAYLTPTYVVWYAMGVGDSFDTVVYRVLRSNPSMTPIATVLPGAPGIETFAATDGGIAYLATNADGDGTNSLWTAPFDAAPTLYPRPITTSGLTAYNGTNQFLFNDRLAGIPGLYRISPGAASGTLTGLTPIRPAVTQWLSISHARALYNDDMTADYPLFLRNVTGGAAGAETTVTSWTQGHAVGLSGPFAVFTRPGTTSSTTQVLFGPVEGPFTTRTFPTSEIGMVGISGRTVYLTNGARARLIDVVTNTVTDLGHVYVGVFGQYAWTINYDTGVVQRRNLASGAVATVDDVVTSGCTADCVDEERPQISAWGNEVVYAVQLRAGGTVAKRWTPTLGLQDLTMLTTGGEPQWYELKYWAGLLLVSRVGGEIRLYDWRSGADTTGIWLDSDAERPLGLDGHVAGWRPNSHLRAAVYPLTSALGSGYVAEPRYLGGDVPAGFGPGVGLGAWRTRMYTSQDVDWKLEVKSATGELVHTEEGSSQYGLVRPSSWNGTNMNTGTPVPQGTYTWTLTGNADNAPSVPLRTGDGGSTGVSGTVYYSAAALGAPTVTAPVLSTDTSASTTFTISWTPPAGAPAGTTYAVQRSTNGGAYGRPTVTSATSLSVAGTAGTTYRFKVNAIDPAGRAGAVSAEKATVVPYDDTSGTYGGSWSTALSSSLYRGSHHKSGSAGATYTLTATGSRIYLVGTRGTSYGQLQVSIDGGAYSSAIDTYSATSKYRQVLYSKTGLSNATHTIKVRVVGTSGRPYVSVDGVGFLR